jgi:hypothetical protein
MWWKRCVDTVRTTSLAVGEIAAEPKTGDAETNGKFHKESFGNRSQKPVYYRRSEWLPSVLIGAAAVNKMTFSDSTETMIGSDMNIGPDIDPMDGVTSTITSRGEINFMKSFSLNVTLYRDKKDDVLVMFSSDQPLTILRKKSVN